MKLFTYCRHVVTVNNADLNTGVLEKELTDLGLKGWEVFQVNDVAVTSNKVIYTVYAKKAAAASEDF